MSDVEMLMFIIDKSGLDVQRALEGNWAGEYDLYALLDQYNALRKWYADSAEIDRLQNAIAEWSRETFKRDSPLGALAHLKSEADELFNAPRDIWEYADCLMLLLDAAHIVHISGDALIEAAWAKLAKNRARTWGPANAEGFSEHVEEEL